MQIQFFRRRNSLMLPVPSKIAKEIGAVAGQAAEMTAENGVLVVKVAKRRRRRRYDLEKLINAITEENRHPEIDWGPAVGNEVW